MSTEPTQGAPEGAATPYPPVPADQLTKLLSNPNYTEADRAVLLRYGRGEISGDEVGKLITGNVQADIEQRNTKA
jgi:hypothetical protein